MFCNFGSSNNQALTNQEISKVGNYLIMQVKYFLVFNQAVTKDISKISCTPTLAVPFTLDEEIVDHKKLDLIATINLREVVCDKVWFFWRNLFALRIGKLDQKMNQ